MSQSNSTNDKKKDLATGITKISVRGYKSLYEECSIEVRPLTILAGANSSGKSSIIQPLLLMKQTLEATYDPGSLLLNGPHVKFTLSEQLFSKVFSKSNTKTFNINLEIDQNKSIFNLFKKQPKKEIEIIEAIYQENERKLVVRPEMNREAVMLILRNLYKNTDLEDFFIAANGEIFERLEWVIVRERCFLNLICKSVTPALLEDKSFRIPVTLYDSNSHTNLFESHIRKLIHVPGVRGNPERTYKTTAIGSEFPGTFENYVASVVNYWQKTKDERLKELGNSLEILGLTHTVQAKQIDDIQVELRVGRLPKNNRIKINDTVNIADVGFGVSQTLPVLVSLLVAEAGQLVYLEEPEMHLHPRAQIGLAEVLANAANRGVRVVVETHSELLLLAIQSLVAEGKLSPEKVKLHWFTQREDGFTKVSSADLDEAGAFGDWPEDFGDVSLKLESRYLNAAEARLRQHSHGG